jgi:hypothetical protein
VASTLFKHLRLIPLRLICRVSVSSAKLALCLITSAALTGCASDTEIAQRRAVIDDAKCESYGAKPGEPAYVQCRAQLDAARTGAIAAAASGGAAAPAAPMQYPPIVYPAAPHPGRF